jgi:hypothetical protein
LSIKAAEIQERMVTAMCLWEHFLDLRRDKHYPRLLRIGVCDARDQIVALVPDCHKAWRKIEREGDEAVEEAGPYDINFCREFLIDHIHRIN